VDQFISSPLADTVHVSTPSGSPSELVVITPPFPPLLHQLRNPEVVRVSGMIPSFFPSPCLPLRWGELPFSSLIFSERTELQSRPPFLRFNSVTRRQGQWVHPDSPLRTDNKIGPLLGFCTFFWEARISLSINNARASPFLRRLPNSKAFFVERIFPPQAFSAFPPSSSPYMINLEFVRPPFFPGFWVHDTVCFYLPVFSIRMSFFQQMHLASPVPDSPFFQTNIYLNAAGSLFLPSPSFTPYPFLLQVPVVYLFIFPFFFMSKYPSPYNVLAISSLSLCQLASPFPFLFLGDVTFLFFSAYDEEGHLTRLILQYISNFNPSPLLPSRIEAFTISRRAPITMWVSPFQSFFPLR